MSSMIKLVGCRELTLVLAVGALMEITQYGTVVVLGIDSSSLVSASSLSSGNRLSICPLSD
jgi:hypothetical protein